MSGSAMNFFGRRDDEDLLLPALQAVVEDLAPHILSFLDVPTLVQKKLSVARGKDGLPKQYIARHPLQDHHFNQIKNSGTQSTSIRSITQTTLKDLPLHMGMAN
eukprot:scaffold380972_cov55-Attheya_sp.AAC.1